MINQPNQIENLINKTEWTPDERKFILDFLENSDATELKQLMQKYFTYNIENSTIIDRAVSENLLINIHQKISIDRREHTSKLVRIWSLRMAAACFIGFTIFSTFLWIKKNPHQPIVQTSATDNKYKNDVEPGGYKAILTLADGSAIVLDDAPNGVLAQQGNTKVTKINGKLNYDALASPGDEVLFNTISTPRGGQYQIELPDGSKVWLNASSSLRFPNVFAGKERRVEITGEVYFEVAKNKTKPFIVNANGAEIQVLGTHFNVMAYNDETILKTTLLEGAVKFVKDGNITLLKPGQQSQLGSNGQFKVVSNVDVAKVVAWKNGYFDFDGADFETIAKQLSRWYDVKVTFNGKIDDIFYAEIPRNTRLSDVLKALELTGKIHFKIEGKQIVVIP